MTLATTIDQLYQDFFGPLEPLLAGGSSDQLLLDFFGSLLAGSEDVPPPTPTDDRRIVLVRTTNLYNDPLYGKPRGVRYDQGLVAWVQLPLFSPTTGAPLIIDVGSYSTAPTISVRIQEASLVDPRTYEPDEDAELSSDGGSVLFAVPVEVMDVAGVYTATVRVVDGGGIERVRDTVWLYVDRSLWTSTDEVPTLTGIPTFAEIRSAIRDHPAANRLLGDYEFDPAEIGRAVVAAVQKFNSGYPVLPKQYRLTTRRIPGDWADPVRMGTLAALFEVAATYFRRGNLPYASGGLSVNDLAKDKEYQAMVESLRTRYEQWVKTQRQTISMSQAWGSVSSGMPDRPTY